MTRTKRNTIAVAMLLTALVVWVLLAFFGLVRFSASRSVRAQAPQFLFFERELIIGVDGLRRDGALVTSPLEIDPQRPSRNHVLATVRNRDQAFDLATCSPEGQLGICLLPSGTDPVTAPATTILASRGGDVGDSWESKSWMSREPNGNLRFVTVMTESGRDPSTCIWRARLWVWNPDRARFDDSDAPDGEWEWARTGQGFDPGCFMPQNRRAGP